MSIFESYANISTVDSQILKDLSDAIADGGAILLDIDSGQSAGRSVVTIAGNSAALTQALLNLVRIVTDSVNMHQWVGNHPCIGATDVLPITPLAESTIEQADILANELAVKIAKNFKIPVYYQNLTDSINLPRNLFSLRKGGFLGLAKKFSEFKPDFGPNSPHPTAGACIVGARDFLVPINFNLDSQDISIAKELAEKIRTTGNGKPGGQGMFKDCMAIGWYVEEYGCAQVSTNLTNYRVTPPHVVFEALKYLAESRGVKVTGSELIGLIPEDALAMAASYYGKSDDYQENLSLATEILGLSSVKDFGINSKLLERRYASLTGQSIVAKN